MPLKLSLSPLLSRRARKRSGALLALLLLASVSSACPAHTQDGPARLASAEIAPQGEAPKALSQDGLTLFFTTDEHGQILARKKGSKIVSGAANLAGLLKAQGFVPGERKALLLSGGDSWTGPAVSTYFKGESTVEAFNALGYDAAALGNHDLDFGQDELAARAAQAKYPILAANVITSEGAPPKGLRPRLILKSAGLKVGVIGLGFPHTPRIALAENIEGLRFLAAGPVLEKQVPAMRAEGADLIVVIAHLCGPALLDLTPLAARLGVAAMLGGHCHERVVARKDGVLVIEGGHYMETLQRIDLHLDPESHRLIDAEVLEIPVSYPAGEKNPVTPGPALTEIVSRWEKKAEEKLGTVIGYSTTGVGVGPGMYAMVTDAWLAAWPSAQIAISNTGAFRQSIPAGKVTLSDIVAVLPFENTLVAAKVTGAQILENLACCGGAVAGLEYEIKDGVTTAWLPDKRPLDPEAYYLVIMNSFMWGGGDGFLFHKQAVKAEDTSIHWRDPVIRWIEKQGSNEGDPLEDHLESRTRFRPLPRPTEGAPAE